MTDFKPMDVNLGGYLLLVRGTGSPFAAFSDPTPMTWDAVIAEVLSVVRWDREKSMVNAHGNHPNPTQDLATVSTFDSCFNAKQKLYNTLPAVLEDGTKVLDAFICLGSRFGLEPILCLVEVKMAGGTIWVDVSYLVQPYRVAATVDVIPVSFGYSQTVVADKLESQRQADAKYAARAKADE